jgi:hypothetical protein
MVPFCRVECAAKDREILWRWNKKARRKWEETTLRAEASGFEQKERKWESRRTNAVRPGRVSSNNNLGERNGGSSFDQL